MIKFDVLNRYTGKVQFTAEIDCEEDALRSIGLGLAVKWAIKCGANLYGADLINANLTGADLSGANLYGAKLGDADLSGANLIGADLINANLTGADLTGAKLINANLYGADLSGAKLSGANLYGADLSGAKLGDADLSGAKGLNDEQLRTFKADLFLTLTSLKTGELEALHLIEKLKAGEIDGSTYGGRNGCACLVGTLANAKKVNVNTLDSNNHRPAEQWFSMIKPGDKPGDKSGGGYAAQKALEWIQEWCALNGIEVPAQGEKIENNI